VGGDRAGRSFGKGRCEEGGGKPSGHKIWMGTEESIRKPEGEPGKGSRWVGAKRHGARGRSN